MTRHRIANRLTFVCVLAGLLTASFSRADESLEFDIPKQRLADALLEFSEASHIKIFFSSETAQRFESAPLQGRFTPEDALRILLAPSGLRYRFTQDDTVVVNEAQAKTLSGADLLALSPMEKFLYAATEPMPEDTPLEQEDMTVTAQPWDPSSYNVPNATTATKTDTPLMETPLNIQVIPQQVLKDQQVIRIEKALYNVSGFEKSSFNGSLAGYNLRGFDTRDYYRDGVQVPGVTFQVAETANLERIEVLKGPAAILFGRIEPGGLINLVTKQPLAQPYYALEQQFGSFDFYRTIIDTSGPLTQDDTLLYRLSLAYENAGSFREFNENERVFMNPVLRWNVSPQTQANVWLQYLHSRDPLDYGIPVLGDRPAPVPRERNFGEPGQHVTHDEVRAGFDWSHAFNERWTLRNTFSLIRHSAPLSALLFPDFDPTTPCAAGQPCSISRLVGDAPINDEENYYSTLNLTGKFNTWGVGHTVLLGGDYWRGQYDATSRYVSSGIPSIDLFNPVHTPMSLEVLEHPEFLQEQSNNQSWYGFYVQDQVKLPYDLHLLAGFRYDHAEIDSNSVLNGVADPAFSYAFSEEAVTPRFGLLWQPRPWLSVYGNYVENFGPNNGPNIDRKPLPPQTAQQWELGIKTELYDGKLTGTLAWFDLTKQNIPAPVPNAVLAALGFQTVVGEARNRGLELDISGEIWPGLNAIASYAYIDSEITKDVGTLTDADGNVIGTNNGTTGNRLFNVPRHGGSFWLTYTPQGGFWDGFTLGAGMVTRGQREGNNANTYQLPGYVTANLMFRYTRKVGPSKVSLQFNVDNLTDKDYFTAQAYQESFVVPAAPRTFLGSIRVEW